MTACCSCLISTRFCDLVVSYCSLSELAYLSEVKASNFLWAWCCFKLIYSCRTICQMFILYLTEHQLSQNQMGCLQCNLLSALRLTPLIEPLTVRGRRFLLMFTIATILTTSWLTLPLVLQRLWRRWLGQLWPESPCSACVKREMPSSWQKLGKSSRRKKTWRKVRLLLHFISHHECLWLSTPSSTPFLSQVSLFLLVCQLTTAYAITPLLRVTLMSYWRMGTSSKCKLPNIYMSILCTW